MHPILDREHALDIRAMELEQAVEKGGFESHAFDLTFGGGLGLGGLGFGVERLDGRWEL